MNWFSAPMKGLYAASIVAVSFFISLWTMDYFSPPCPPGKDTVLGKPFAKFDGFAFVAAAPTLDSVADSGASPKRSSVLVCENNRLLGPSHSLHSDVAAKGLGLFSHWAGAGFVFSTTDNSDPNTNGRYYRAVQPK
jgi:hypothetical protein